MPLFHCKYKGVMPLFQDLRLHKLPFFQFSNSIQMHALYAEEELRNEIERQKNFYRLQHTEKSIE